MGGGAKFRGGCPVFVSVGGPPLLAPYPLFAGLFAPHAAPRNGLAAPLIFFILMRHQSRPQSFQPSSRHTIHHERRLTCSCTNMATATTTETARKRGIPKNLKLPPESERYMRCCADVASALIQDHEAQADGSGRKRDLNLNALRGQMAKKHYLSRQPPLTDIIAAVPEHYKKYILPKLIAKPISKSSLWNVHDDANTLVQQEHHPA